MDSIPVLILVGPTASGKTELLQELFDGRNGLGLPPAEIVSADSMQAYRGMDIGTAKPGPEALARLPHRLIDIRDPDEQYTAGDFVRLADEACAEITASGRFPVVSGGTGFYVRNFIHGLPGGPAAETEVRAAVARDLAEKGETVLRAELAAVDPESAARIATRDTYRLTRAVEILRQTGRAPSEFAPPSMPRAGYDFLVVEAARPREVLYRRIDARVDAMFERGLADEVAALRAAGYGPEAPGMKAIGYSEFFGIGPAAGRFRELAEKDLRAIAEAIKLDTRRYAKRQETFFRAFAGRKVLSLEGEGGPSPGNVEELRALVAGFLERLKRRDPALP
jgi:tRNA dimethylallyltransferase